MHSLKKIALVVSMLVSVAFAAFPATQARAQVFNQNQLTSSPYWGIVMSDGIGSHKATASSSPTLNYLTATSTSQASLLPLASTTAVTATSFCFTLDVCRTTWPTSGDPFTHTSVYTQTTSATSTLLALTGSPFSLVASSTVNFVNASSTNATIFTSLFLPNVGNWKYLATNGSGVVVATTSSPGASGSSVAWPFTTTDTNFGVAVQSTTTPEWFKGNGTWGLFASSTSVFDNASTTNLTLFGTLFAGSGLVTLPAYTFAGDSDTGLYNSSAGVIGFSSNGNLLLSFTTAGLLMNSFGSASSPSFQIGGTNTGLFGISSGFGFSANGSEAMRLTATRQLGIATTTPFWNLTVASSTGPQLALSDGNAANTPWTMRAINNNLYFATSTALATSTVAALSIDGTTDAFTFNSGATSTFSSGLNAKYLNLTGTAASSSFANGVDLSAGCFSISGTCLQTIVSSASAYKQAVRFASTSTLPTNTYSNGVGGVGATLTGTANGPFYIDGNTPTVGDRVLIKNEGTGANNGIYTVTTLGVAGLSAFVLTRATDYNSSADVFPGVANFVNGGTQNANTCWVLTNTTAVTIGTTALTYADECGAGSFTGTFPITISGTTISFSGISTSSAPTIGNLAYWTAANTLGTVATTSATCSGTVSCTGFNVLGSSPITITGTAGNDPFTHSSVFGQTTSATSTMIALTGSPFSLVASSTAEFVYASTTALTVFNSFFGANLSTCTGSNFLQWSAGAFGCAAGSAGSQTPWTQNIDGASYVLTNAGQVGIGTSSPYALLSISATSTTGIGAPTTLFAVASSTAGTATSTLFSILNTGNVGIGTTSPNSWLTIDTGQSSTTPISIFQTWNDSTKTFTGISANITNTNSGALSDLMNLKVNGTSMFRLTKGGTLTLPKINVTSEWQQNSATVLTFDEALTSTFVGKGAGRVAATGGNNIVVGTQAGDSMTSGNRNAILGYNAGTAITTADQTTAIGNNAASAFESGTSNTFLGVDVGGIGTFVSGNGNVMIGDAAGWAATTGDVNTFIGATAGAATDVSTSTAIGYGALVTASNQLKIGQFLTGTNINSAAGTLTFSYGSTTQVSATSLCLTGDSCRTIWPVSFTWPWTIATTYGTTTNATTTPTWFRTSFYASSTIGVPSIIDNVIIGSATTTAATTTSLAVTGITSSLLKTTSTGGVVAYVGSAPCSNQVALSISVAGVLTCTSITDAMFSGALGYAHGGTATTTWLTNSVPFFNGTTFTEDNTNFKYSANLLTLTSASTTNLTISGFHTIPNGSSQTVTKAGQIAVDTTTGQLLWHDGTNSHVNNGHEYFSFNATSTAVAAGVWLGTSTILVENIMQPGGETYNAIRCTTNVGTVNVDIYQGSTHIALFNASTTNNKITFTANNTMSAGNLVKADIGTPASSMRNITCTLDVSSTAD